jgi:hypothetical protein
MRKRFVLAALFLLATGSAARGQVQFPPETRNAALRYWQAFAEMKDPPADAEVQAIMAKLGLQLFEAPTCCGRRQKQAVCESLRHAIPSAQMVNNNRIDMISARKDLLDALAAH